MSPLLIFILVFAVIVGGVAVALRVETKRAGGIKPWLADFPTTPGRIFVSILLAVFFVVITMLITVISVTNPGEVRPLPDVVLDTVSLFLLMMMGIDTVAYIAKRMTHQKYADGGSDPPPGSTQQMPVQGGTRIQTEGAATVTVVPPTTEGEQ